MATIKRLCGLLAIHFATTLVGLTGRLAFGVLGRMTTPRAPFVPEQADSKNQYANGDAYPFGVGGQPCGDTSTCTNKAKGGEQRYRAACGATQDSCAENKTAARGRRVGFHWISG